MSEQFTKYERIWIDGLNRGDVSVADDVFEPHCVIHIAGSPEPNLPVSGFKQMIAGLLAAFPDIQLTIEDQVITADKVATRWTAAGTHTGPLGDVKPTGRRIRIGGLILDHVSGDRVVRALGAVGPSWHVAAAWCARVNGRPDAAPNRNGKGHDIFS